MTLMQKTVAQCVAVAFSLSAVSAIAATNLTGAGGTFPAPVYNKWAAEYNKVTGAQVNYQGIGSSGGVKQIIAKTVDFGASDAPLKDEDLQKNGLFQFPTVIGGVVLAVNIPGIKAGQWFWMAKPWVIFIWATSKNGAIRQLPVESGGEIA